jgi:hypothetical protein
MVAGALRKLISVLTASKQVVATNCNGGFGLGVGGG